MPENDSQDNSIEPQDLDRAGEGAVDAATAPDRPLNENMWKKKARRRSSRQVTFDADPSAALEAEDTGSEQLEDEAGEAGAQARAETQTQTEAQARAEEPVAESELEPERILEAHSESTPEPEPEPDADQEVEPGAGAGQEVEPGADADQGAEHESESDPVLESEHKPEPASERDDTETDDASESVLDSESEPESETHIEPESEATSVSESELADGLAERSEPDAHEGRHPRSKNLDEIEHAGEEGVFVDELSKELDSLFDEVAEDEEAVEDELSSLEDDLSQEEEFDSELEIDSVPASMLESEPEPERIPETHSESAPELEPTPEPVPELEPEPEPAPESEPEPEPRVTDQHTPTPREHNAPRRAEDRSRQTTVPDAWPSRPKPTKRRGRIERTPQPAFKSEAALQDPSQQLPGSAAGSKQKPTKRKAEVAPATPEAKPTKPTKPTKRDKRQERSAKPQKFLRSSSLKQAFRNFSKLDPGAAWRETYVSIIVFMVLFALVALAVADQLPVVDAFNTTINTLVHSTRGTFDGLVVALTTLGDFIPMAGLCLLICVFLYLRKKWDSLAFFVTNVVLSVICVQALKLIFAIPRPGDDTLVPLPISYSFPSAHSFCSLIVFGMIGLLIYRAMVARGVHRENAMIPGIILIAFAFLVGLSRIYVGVHWPSDVLGGWLLGGAWLAFAGALYTAGSRQKQPVR